MRRVMVLCLGDFECQMKCIIFIWTHILIIYLQIYLLVYVFGKVYVYILSSVTQHFSTSCLFYDNKRATVIWLSFGSWHLKQRNMNMMVYKVLWAWGWPCFDTKILPFSYANHALKILFSIRTTWFTKESRKGCIKKKLNSSLASTCNMPTFYFQQLNPELSKQYLDNNKQNYNNYLVIFVFIPKPAASDCPFLPFAIAQSQCRPFPGVHFTK